MRSFLVAYGSHISMAVLAEITAIGGGVIRDLVIGAIPLVAFTDSSYFWIPLLATALTFFAHVQMNRLNAAVLVFDAAGLAVFCISGTAKALTYGLGPVPTAVLGVITAVGDVLAHDEPSVLRVESKLYALPAFLGSAIVVVIPHLPIDSSLAAALPQSSCSRCGSAGELLDPGAPPTSVEYSGRRGRCLIRAAGYET